MHRIGVIGDNESVLGFKAVGLDVFPAASAAEAESILDRISEESYAIIYVTEGLYKDMNEGIEECEEKRLPAVIPIPGIDGTYGIGIANLKKAVERAVGADILFGNE